MAPKKPVIKPKVKPTPKETLPSLKEFKKSAAYKTNSMTYKEYLDSFRGRKGYR